MLCMLIVCCVMFVGCLFAYIGSVSCSVHCFCLKHIDCYAFECLFVHTYCMLCYYVLAYVQNST